MIAPDGRRGATGEEEKSFSPSKRIAVLSAEMDARLAALEGGDDYATHQSHIKWIAAMIWDLKQERPR